MKILYLIGNGFDLNIGMATRYSDFYKLFDKADSKYPQINELKKSITGDIHNWSDLELAFGRYTENLSTVSDFDLVYENLVENLSKYLEDEESKININSLNRKKFVNDLINPGNFLANRDKSALKKYTDQWKNIEWELSIVTLNYTRIIDKLLGADGRAVPIGNHNGKNVIFRNLHHLHGYTDDLMVLGVNDISQIGNVSFREKLDVVESIVKPSANLAMKHAVEEECQNLIRDANLICLFGVSLGDSDRFWWDYICKHLNQNTRMVIFERNDGIPPLIASRRGRIERSVIDRMIRKMGLPEGELNAIRNRIFVGINSNIFDISK